MEDGFWTTVAHDFRDLPDLAQSARLAIRMFLAAFLGGLLGLERENVGKDAGVRTHMLVSLGAALFVFTSQQEGMSNQDISRVVQGIITGIGFIGAGAILKLDNERRIEGLTTAAGIWLTAAIGVSVGAGKLSSAVLGTALALLILSVLQKFSPGNRKMADEG